MKCFAILILSLLTILSASYFGYKEFTQSYHIHSDFVLFIDGTQFNFTQPEYMTSTDICATDYTSKHTHLHDANGSVIHIHKKEQTVGDFFKSIGFALTDDSLTVNTQVVYKNNTNKKWQFFINGMATSSLQDYPFTDLDQILLSYGNPKTTDISTELTKMTHTACVYSEKCPKPVDMVLPIERCGSDE